MKKQMLQAQLALVSLLTTATSFTMTNLGTLHCYENPGTKPGNRLIYLQNATDTDIFLEAPIVRSSYSLTAKMDPAPEVIPLMQCQEDPRLTSYTARDMTEIKIGLSADPCKFVWINLPTPVPDWAPQELTYKIFFDGNAVSAQRIK